jgi:SAM-dependent methyltransferase
MPAHFDLPPPEKGYVFDLESGPELTRLIYQERLLTNAFDEQLPESLDLSAVHDILDIACGPGSWALDMAYRYPKINVVGIDISKSVIEYVSASARSQGIEDNASFLVMDATKQLAFPDNSFDLVHARLLLGFMLPDAWPALLQECLRITRPGGVICLTECEGSLTSSPALEQLNGMGMLAMKLAGRSFSPDGRSFGITPMLAPLLRDAGYQETKIKAHAIDFSAGTVHHNGFYQDFVIILELARPLLLKLNLTTQEEAERLYYQALAEMMQNDFCALWYFLTAWGKKSDPFPLARLDS